MKGNYLLQSVISEQTYSGPWLVNILINYIARSWLAGYMWFINSKCYLNLLNSNYIHLCQRVFADNTFVVYSDTVIVITSSYSYKSHSNSFNTKRSLSKRCLILAIWKAEMYISINFVYAIGDHLCSPHRKKKYYTERRVLWFLSQ